VFICKNPKERNRDVERRTNKKKVNGMFPLEQKEKFCNYTETVCFSGSPSSLLSQHHRPVCKAGDARTMKNDQPYEKEECETPKRCEPHAD
jgi:hypothetical protein